MRRTKRSNPRLVLQIVDCGALIRGLMFLESWTDPSARRFRDRQRAQKASTGWWGTTHVRLHLQCCNRSVGLRINDPVYEIRNTPHGASPCSYSPSPTTQSRFYGKPTSMFPGLGSEILDRCQVSWTELAQSVQTSLQFGPGLQEVQQSRDERIGYLASGVIAGHLRLSLGPRRRRSHRLDDVRSGQRRERCSKIASFSPGARIHSQVRCPSSIAAVLAVLESFVERVARAHDVSTGFWRSFHHRLIAHLEPPVLTRMDDVAFLRRRALSA